MTVDLKDFIAALIAIEKRLDAIEARLNIIAPQSNPFK